MSSFFLSFDGDQINEAISGSHFLLRDSWGFTGDLKLQGDSYLSGINSKKVATFDLVVTGSQTGHGSLTNLNFTNTNNFSATGNSFLSAVTGRSNFDVISVKTGFLPLVTGDSTFYNGDFVFTGFNFYSTGTDFSFLSENNFSVVGADIFKISGFDKLNVTTDEFNYKGRSHFNGNAYFTGDFHVSGEVYVSGIKLTNITGATINIINQISFDGSAGIGQFYQAKGDILVGTGISGAQTLILGTHGQILQVDTGHQLGVKWVPSGTFGGGVVGSTGLSGWVESISTTLNSFIPTKDSFVIGKDSAVVNLNSFSIGFGNSASIFSGPSILVGTGNRFLDSSFSMAVGRNNSIKSNTYSNTFGEGNSLDRGDYSFVGGYSNNIAGTGNFVLGRSNLITGYYDGGFSQTFDNSYYKILGSNNVVTGDLSTSIQGILIGDRNSGVNFGTNAPIILGNGNYQSGVGSIMIGDYHTNAGVNSSNSHSVCIGRHGVNKRYGEFVWSVNDNPVQSSDFMFYGTTTNNTVTEIFLGGNSNSRLVIDSGKTMLLHFLVVAKTSTEMASYSIKVVAKNVAGTLTVSTTSLEVIQEDDSTWTVDFDADNTNKSVRARVTGTNSKTINWGIRGFGIEI